MKTSAILLFVGVLTAHGGTLKIEQRNEVFQPGGAATSAPSAGLKRGAVMGHPVWRGSRVMPITPGAQLPVKTTVGGRNVNRVQAAAVTPGLVTQAGGRR